MPTPWMIYGANGYTGELIAREAARRGMKPTLAGRTAAKLEPLAAALGLPFKAFALDNPVAIEHAIGGMFLVLHCAGPFSKTAAPMMAACINQRAHYLDITGEIAVFEHAQTLDKAARASGIVICPGAGFDVIPTDCIAARLKAALPDATHLALGFDSRSGFSPGTAKTSVEGLGAGGKVRIRGEIKSVPLAYKTRRIDFGAGEKRAMTIPWGDISTAFATTQIPNIECYIPGSPRMIANARRANWLRWLLKLGPVQAVLKRRIEKTVQGPTETTRQASETYVWGEVTNARGDTKTARIKTANGYALTVTGSLALVEHLQTNKGVEGGTCTPSQLAGSALINRLPGSGPLTIS
ncbi:MAG: saccharopine dehydrogenase NADP-binding domain-containing protein [Hyphomicrobiaceae bacterium]